MLAGRDMTSLLKISEAASLALHTVCFLAQKGEELATTNHIAVTLGVSGAHLSKVLQRMAKAGLVESVRGPSGGWRLARKGADITLLEVYEAIEGRLAPAECLLGSLACGGECMMGDLVRQVNCLVMERLTKTKVSELGVRFGEEGRNA